MKKIITALADPKLSLKIKEECNVEIITPDIQYQDGVLEILEKNNNAEILILNSLLEGNLNIFDFINKIKEKNNLIKIIIILEEQDIELENFLNAKRIVDIFYNNKNTINELIKNINEKFLSENKNEINEEIKILKQLLLEKNKKNKLKNKIKNSKLINKLFNKKNIKKIKSKNIKEKLNNNNLICVVGSSGVGKSIFCCAFSKIIKNKKILIIDFDNINSSINSFFGIKKEKNKITKINKNIDLIAVKNIEKNKLFFEKYYKKYNLIICDINLEKNKNLEILLKSNLIIFISEANLIGIEKSKNLLNKYLEKINYEKINIILNKINFNSIDEKILKNIFSEFNILGKIKLNKNYDLAINSNLKIINKKIKNDYLKIINKIIN